MQEHWEFPLEMNKKFPSIFPSLILTPGKGEGKFPKSGDGGRSMCLLFWEQYPNNMSEVSP